MAAVADNSANSLALNGTGGPAAGIPNDGTGTTISSPGASAVAIASGANKNAGVVELDPWLSPFKDSLKRRFTKAQDWIKTIDETGGGIEKFSRVRDYDCGYAWWYNNSQVYHP